MKPAHHAREGAALRPWERVAVGATAALLLAGAFVGCSGETVPEEPPLPGPNLLFVSIDTLRADHTGLHGYRHDTTPRLAAFAAGGVRFERAYATMPTTGPSHASMLTGLYPAEHGVLWNGMRLADEHETLAEILGASGYQTAAVVSSFPLATTWGYAQGFQDYVDDFEESDATVVLDSWNEREVGGAFDQRGERTTDEAIQWLDEGWARSAPFFLFVHYFDPHGPYLAPPELRSRFLPESRDRLAETIALYDQEIFYVDRALGRLLDHLANAGLEEGTLVVVTADHGEGLMQHGHLEHGIHLYEEAMHVPLVFRWPGVLPSGTVVHEAVSLVDMTPTLLDLLELPHPRDYSGRSLAGLLRGEPSYEPEPAIFMHRRRYDPPQQVGGVLVSGEQWAIRRGDYKLIAGEEEGQVQLFNLSVDPLERVEIGRYHPERVQRLRAELDAWRESTGTRSDPRVELTPDERRALEALGYAE